MSLSGELFIGHERVRSNVTFHALSALTGEALAPAFSEAEQSAVDRACELAWSVFDRFREMEAGVRARFLEAIGERMLAAGDELLDRAHVETALPRARLIAERTRTVGQLRLFADELRTNQWLGIRVDAALPDRKPVARPDLRQRRVPLGPVAVFGASNFPLAFSVAGGDTAAALAAGCPVVVKGHPAHPGTSEIVARAIVAAAEECGLPSGVFSLLSGKSNAVGAALVAQPRIKAVGFTGSRVGGLALMKIANARPEPIPVYAEMSSVNPVLLLPAALKSRAEALGAEFAGSLTLGAGQFCTNPGLVLACDGDGLERFVEAARSALEQSQPGAMLTAGIRDAYDEGVLRVARHARVASIVFGERGEGKADTRPALFSVAARELLRDRELMQEIFGPASIVVRCENEEAMLEVMESLEGQLTATLHFAADDEALAARLIPVLERKAGRLIANGWPTGVEVAHAMVHGGPFPATSDGRSTSVGTLAIERFLRPVCYQDFSDRLLPWVHS